MWKAMFEGMKRFGDLFWDRLVCLTDYWCEREAGVVTIGN